MKYTELTQEQKESITPCLRELFDYLHEQLNNGIYLSYIHKQIKAYQKAQKAEIERMEETFIMFYEHEGDYLYKLDECKANYDKLKFESELE